jgi:hypothetical protein
MDAPVEKTDGTSDLAFSQLRNAVSRHDEEAVASISYRLLTSGHRFDSILAQAVAAVNFTKRGAHDNTEKEIEKDSILKVKTSAYLVVVALVFIFPNRTQDVVSPMKVSDEKKISLSNREVEISSSKARWTSYITGNIGNGIRLSPTLLLHSRQSPSAPRLHNSPNQKLPFSMSTGQMDLHSPSNVGMPQFPPPDGAMPSKQSAAPVSDGAAAGPQSYISRGDKLLVAGDVAAARLLYRRAAESGNAIAAIRLGGTYDSKILAQAGLTATLGNAGTAALWYKRAQDMQNPNR